MPTTGYDDVKRVALARIIVTNVPSIQVDWALYGPKLAQVALTVGADDVDAVSAEDDESQGRRRAPLEEIQRNIRAASQDPVERNGRFDKSTAKSTTRADDSCRLGAVGYLNARPLVYSLDRSRSFSLRFDVPSQVRRPAACRRHRRRPDSLDRVPARQARLQIVPDLAIASRGAGHVGDALHDEADERRALDRHGHQLAHIGRARARPVREAVQDRAGVRTARHLILTRCSRARDAALMIGDNALFFEPRASRRRRSVEKIDLGEAWTRLTGLPFVYAFWAGRPRCVDAGARRGAAADARRAASRTPRRSRASTWTMRPSGRRSARGTCAIISSTIWATRKAQGSSTFYRYAAEIGVAPARRVTLLRVTPEGVTTTDMVHDLIDKVRARASAIDAAEALELYRHAPTPLLGQLADAIRAAQASGRHRHLHHRPQRQLHERLRREVQLLRVLPRRSDRRTATCSGSTSCSERSTRRSPSAASSCCCRAGTIPTCR